MISCTSPLRAAYGWQRDGGMAEYLLAEESTCVALSEPLTYLDGANIACGFGTVWEALTRIGVSGRDHLLVVGLGPVGMAALLLGKALGARQVIGVGPRQRGWPSAATRGWATCSSRPGPTRWRRSRRPPMARGASAPSTVQATPAAGCWPFRARVAGGAWCSWAKAAR